MDEVERLFAKNLSASERGAISGVVEKLLFRMSAKSCNFVGCR